MSNSFGENFVYANKRRNQGSEEGEVDMAARREKRDEREQAAQDQDDPALDVEYKNLTHAEPSPLSE